MFYINTDCEDDLSNTNPAPTVSSESFGSSGCNVSDGKMGDTLKNLQDVFSKWEQRGPPQMSGSSSHSKPDGEWGDGGKKILDWGFLLKNKGH